MGLETQTPGAAGKTSPATKLKPGAPVVARMLIVCDDEKFAGQLKRAFRGEGYVLECAKSITAACESAKSGRFQVVVTTPVLGDGSWRRLVDIASHYHLGFVVVLVASNFDLNQWAEALEAGAFDVLDALHELPKAAETAKRAFWAAYLKGSGPGPEVAGSPKAA
jgi:DNA-binding NtrC family response regulator